MSTLTQIIANLWWINLLLILFLVFMHNGSPKSTAMWIMVLAFTSVFGFVLYLIFGQDYRKRKMFELKEEQDQVVSLVSYAQRDDFERGFFPYDGLLVRDYGELALLNLTGEEGFYTEKNAVETLFDGQEKFERLIDDMMHAKKTIDIQYYIFKSDKIGKRILSVLEQKLDEGVRVRLLYDAIGGRFMKREAIESFRRHGGQVAVFFPSPFAYLNLRINFRNHRKLVVIDDEIGYIGGFNVGDEYLEPKKLGYWRDTHLRIHGNAVWALKTRFLKDWYYASGDNSSTDSIITREIKSQGSTGIQIISSGPDTQVEHIKLAFIRMIATAKESILIQSPYFIPDESVRDALITAMLSGVKVQIMIPCKPDHPFVYWASLWHLGELLKYGAEGYLYNNGFLHAKTMVIDDDLATVGSANMDIRSFALNFETNAVLYGEESVMALRNQFMEDLKHSSHLNYELYQKRPLGVKFKQSFSRLLSPIL